MPRAQQQTRNRGRHAKGLPQEYDERGILPKQEKRRGSATVKNTAGPGKKGIFGRGNVETTPAKKGGRAPGQTRGTAPKRSEASKQDFNARARQAKR